MSNNRQIIGGTALALVIFGGSYLARKGIGKAWTSMTNEPPPPEQDNADVELIEAATWAVVTGTAVGLLRFAIRRVNYRGSLLD